MGKKMANTSFLPQDIVLEILPRLAVKSLLRFSCVAKSWNSLIFSHEFSKNYLKYLKRHSSFEYRIMLRNRDNEFKNIYLHHAALNEPKVRVFDITNTNQFSLGCTFVGSCDGLICMAVGGLEGCYIGHNIVLWNPSIQKIKKLPACFGEETGYGYDRVYGFGYDESRDDYKVVVFYFSLIDPLDVFIVKIYSMKTGELKRIKSHKSRWLVKRPPTFANGKLHWFVEVFDIAYLDLATEEYGILENPDEIGLYWARHSCMTALPGGCLYVSFFSYTIREIWLVEPRYVVGKTNWTEVMRSWGYDDKLEKYLVLGKPLFVLDTGELVMLKKDIIVINLKDRSVRRHRLSSPRDFLIGISYVESLVSPLT